MKNFIRNPSEYGTTPMQPETNRDQKYSPRQRRNVDGTSTISSKMLYQESPMKATRVICSMSLSEARAPDIPFIKFSAESAMVNQIKRINDRDDRDSSSSLSPCLIEVHCLKCAREEESVKSNKKRERKREKWEM